MKKKKFTVGLLAVLAIAFSCTTILDLKETTNKVENNNENLLSGVGSTALMTVEISGYGITLNNHYFYIASHRLDDDYAICIDRGLYTPGLSGTYTNVQDIKGNNDFEYAIRPLLYLKRNGISVANTDAYTVLRFVVAQGMAWQMGNGEISSMFEKYYVQINKSEQVDYSDSAIESIRSEILSQTWDWATQNAYLYSAGNGYQRLISVAEGDNPEEPNECKPITYPSNQISNGTCGNANFSDPIDWDDCITGLEKYSGGISNEYCSVYCQETAQTNFPEKLLAFKAGTYITIGSGYANVWGPVAFTGTQECRSYYKNDKGSWVQGVNTKKFIVEYNELADKVADYYTLWQNAKEYNEAIDSMVEEPKSEDCPYTVEDYGYISTTCYTYKWNEKLGKYVKEDYPCTKWDVVGTHPEYHSRFNTSTKTYQTCYSSGGCTSSRNIDWTCENRPSKSGDESKYQDLYNKAVSRLNSMRSQMASCAAMNTTYDFSPDVTLSSPVNDSYTWTGQLKKNEEAPVTIPSIGNVQKGDRNGSYANCSGASCTANVIQCSGRKCTNSSMIVGTDSYTDVNVDRKAKMTTARVNYTLPDNLYQFVEKVDGFSPKDSLPDYIKNTNFAYRKINDSNLPLDYYLPVGKYIIKMNYSNVGSKKGGTAHFDQLYPDITSENYGGKECTIAITEGFSPPECDDPPCPPVNYYCNYDSDTETWYGSNGTAVSYEQWLIECGDCTTNGSCPPSKGLNLVYRTVKLGDLSTAFPSIDGDGRTPGSNWTNEDVNKYITNNRNVKGEEVYTLTPLYKITLTPAVISEIRKYNKYVGNYGDFNLTCASDGSGKKCLSNFIHGTVKISGNSVNFSSYFDSSATCQNITSGEFYTCADK